MNPISKSKEIQCQHHLEMRHTNHSTNGLNTEVSAHLAHSEAFVLNINLTSTETSLNRVMLDKNTDSI